MRILVSGGSKFDEEAIVWRALDWLHGNISVTELVHGDAPGVDKAAGRWAEQNDIVTYRCPADWNSYYGGLAGRVRNRKMLLHYKPQLVVALPGANGTQHMCDLANEFRYPLMRFDRNGEVI